MSESLRLYLEKEKKIIKDTKEKVAKIWRQLVDEEKLLIKEREELTGPPDTRPRTYKPFSQEQAEQKKAKAEMSTGEYQQKQLKIREINHKIDIIHKKRGVMDRININPPVTGQPTHLAGQAYVDWVQRNIATVDKYSRPPKVEKVHVIPTRSGPASASASAASVYRDLTLTRLGSPPKAEIAFGPTAARRAQIKKEREERQEYAGRSRSRSPSDMYFYNLQAAKAEAAKAKGGKNKRKTNKYKSRKHKKTRRTRR
jgi:hypothetical protein